MKEVSTIGLDLAKSVFQVHGADDVGKIVVRRQLRRRQVLPFFKKLPPCLVGMEACATSHYWAREISTFGHEVRMMPAGYVKPYVKRNKNDAADAEAICEAVTRPSMRPESVSALFLLAIIPPNVNSIRQVLSGIPANGELDMKGFVSLRFGNTPQFNAPANDDKSLTPRRRWQQHVMQVIPRHLRAR